MAEKKSKSKFLTILIYGFAGLCVLFVAFCIIGSITLTGTLSMQGIAATFQNQTALAIFAVVVALCLLFGLMNIDKIKKSSEMKGKDDMENRRFMHDDELDSNFPHYYFEQLKTANIAGVPIRALATKRTVKVHFEKETHVIVLGATGTGKTAYFLDPTIQILTELKTKPSMFITDTKGELFNHNSKNMKEKGYDVKLLDFADAYKSMMWNPLAPIYEDYQKAQHLQEEILKHTNDDIRKYNKMLKVGTINSEEWYEFHDKAFPTLREALIETEVERNKILDTVYEDIKDIVSAICPITNQSESSWEQGARDYTEAVLIAMLEDSLNPALGMTKERFNFYNMSKIALNKNNDFQEVKDYFSGRDVLSKTTQLSSHIVSSRAPTTRDGYMSILAQKLAMFTDMGICLITSKNEFEFEEFDEKPTAFFIKIPDERQTRYELASVCLQQAYQRFVRKARHNEEITGNASLKRPLFFLLDEFANLPKINNLDRMITVSRSRNIMFVLIIQSYSQLEGVYGKEVAQTVRGNCKTTIYLGTPDLYTNEEFSKALGNKTIVVESKSTTPGQKVNGVKQKASTSTSKQFNTVPLIPPSDLNDLQMGHMYVTVFKHLPVKSRFTPWFELKNFYNIGKMDQPYIPGRRLNEQEIFYDIRKRNSIVLGDDYD